MEILPDARDGNIKRLNRVGLSANNFYIQE